MHSPGQLLRRAARGAGLLALCALPMCARAQHYAPEAVKAAFLYRFAAYVEWPASAAGSDRFVIATLCDDPVAYQLDRLVKGRTLNGLPAEVRRVYRSGEIGRAQMLYVGRACSAGLSATRAALSGQPVLIVTDEQRGLRRGAIINFISVSQRVRFEVSLPSARRSGLKISSELLAVAERVLGGGVRSPTRCVAIEAHTAACAPQPVFR